MVKFVKPVTSTMFKNIDDDLEKIGKGEKRIAASFQSSAFSYASNNQQTKDLNNRAAVLANYLREQTTNLEKIE